MPFFLCAVRCFRKLPTTIAPCRFVHAVRQLIGRPSICSDVDHAVVDFMDTVDACGGRNTEMNLFSSASSAIGFLSKPGAALIGTNSHLS